MKDGLKQLKYESNHHLARSNMSKNTQVETLHDVAVSNNELTKWQQETIENVKAQLIDRSMLKTRDTHRNLYTSNIRSHIIEEGIITTPELLHNDHTVQINKTYIQLQGQQVWKVCLFTKYQDFGKELEYPKIMEVPSTQQNSKAFEPKRTCPIVGDLAISNLKENILSKEWFHKDKIFPWKY